MEKSKNIKVSNKIKTSVGYKVFNVFNIILMVVLSLIFIVPYLNIVAQAFNTGTDAELGGITIFPREFTFDNFAYIFDNARLIKAIGISVARTILGPLVALFLQYTAAYVLLKKDLPFRKFILWYLTIPMFIGGGLAAEVLIYKELGLSDTFWIYLLVGNFSFYQMVVIRTYLEGISESLLEAARLDGASEFTCLMKIMLPLSLPVIATILVWTMVSHWNNWTHTLYFCTWGEWDTLQFVIHQSTTSGATMDPGSGVTTGADTLTVRPITLQAAQIVVATLPMICIYPFLQKYFVTGITLGGVKE